MASGDKGISVVFVNGDERIVPAYALERLIQAGRILSFHRSEGWVEIGRDPIRNFQQPLTWSGSRWDDC